MNVVPGAVSARGSRARIYVIFTDLHRTKAALSAAAQLARGLELPLLLLAARRVPYPLALDDPPVAVKFTEDVMSGLVGDLDAEITVQILLCREPEQALLDALGPEALVVMGAGRSWWRPRYRSLVRRLKADGLRLVLID